MKKLFFLASTILGIGVYLWMILACAPTKMGTDYQRTLGAENKRGHAILYLSQTGAGGSTSASIDVLQNDIEVDNFRMKAVDGLFTQTDMCTIIPLDIIGSKYEIVMNIRTERNGVTSKGIERFNVTSSINLVSGIYVQIRTHAFVSDEITIEKEQFTGNVAKYILNPVNVLENKWEDLVSMQK